MLREGVTGPVSVCNEVLLLGHHIGDLRQLSLSPQPRLQCVVNP